MIRRLLPDIWKNKWQIAEGIKNRMFKKEHIEELVDYRLEMCKKCIWYSPNQKGKTYDQIPEVIRKIKDRDWYEDVISEPDARCIHCACNLDRGDSIKLRCLTCKCPIGKWGAVATENEQEEIKKLVNEGVNRKGGNS